METQKLKLEVQGEDHNTSRFLARATQDFARTTVIFAKKHRGVPVIVEQTCWSMALAVIRFRAKHDDVDLFARFLEGALDMTDLLFFLHTRDMTRQDLRKKAAGWVPVNKGEQHMILGKPGYFPSGKHVLEGRKRPIPPPANEARQVLDTVQLVRIIRTCVAGLLQGHLIKRLDEAMREQMQASGDGKSDLHLFTFLKILTTEYHDARETLEGLSPALRLGPSGDPDSPTEEGRFGYMQQEDELGFVPGQEHDELGFDPDQHHDELGFDPGPAHDELGFDPDQHHDELGFDPGPAHDELGFDPGHQGIASAEDELGFDPGQAHDELGFDPGQQQGLDATLQEPAAPAEGDAADPGFHDDLDGGAF